MTILSKCSKLNRMADYDNSYKLLFSHAEMVRDLLLGFVKEDWVQDLDLDSLERVSGSYVSDDIRDRHDDLKLLRNLVSALFRLENSRDPERIMETVTLLLEWLAAPEQDSLRRAFTVWFNRVFFASQKDKPKPPELRELKEVRAMLAERVEEWKKEWKREGRKEGEANILLKLLELKFGELSLEDQKRVQSADSDTLLKWSGRILTADTLDEILSSSRES